MGQFSMGAIEQGSATGPVFAGTGPRYRPLTEGALRATSMQGQHITILLNLYKQCGANL
jgi:hypothetical protein